MNDLADTIHGLTLLAAIVAVPQIPSAVFVFRTLRPMRAPLRVTLVVAPAILFFLASHLYFSQAADHIRARGEYVCGMFGLALQGVQVFLYRRRLRRSQRAEG